MSEVLTIRNKIAAGILTAAAMITMSSCAEEDPYNPGGDDNGGGSETYTPEPDLETTIQLAKFRLKLAGLVDVEACNSIQRSLDADCDGTVNEFDMVPMAKDFADNDLDGVADHFDVWPGQNDWAYDGDYDGIIDAFDAYNNLNDLADNDGDGIINGNDTQPNVPQSQSSEAQDFRTFESNVAYYAQVNEQFKTFLEIDTSPLSTQYESVHSDTDRDGTVDYWDTEPTNWMTGGEYDPYNTGSDAWLDDQEDYWDSDY